ncbi:MAG: DUF4402 domain-containing protein [Pseudomonadota bacterium]
MRFNICLAAAAATLVSASPAFAQVVYPQDTATATAKGVVLESHQLVKATDLDFGIVAGDPLNPGQVSIAADAFGTRSVNGGVTALPGTYSAAKFDGLGAPLETVVLTLTQPGILTDAANDSINAALVLDAAARTARPRTTAASSFMSAARSTLPRTSRAASTAQLST